jgi:hypothetical protein
MGTMTYSGTLTVTTCWCGIKLAVPDNLYRWARQSESNALYCPRGHTFVYGDSEEDRRKRVERQLAHERERRQAERELREHTEHRLRAQKGATTKARKRHAAGVCPVCSRSFQQVRRHMATQHPDYDPAKGVE